MIRRTLWFLQRITKSLKWARRITLLLLILIAACYFIAWRLTLSPTNFYGQPALKHYDEFWSYLSEHPESLIPLNWGIQPALVPFVTTIAVVLYFAQGGPFFKRSWKNVLGGRKPINAPAPFLFATIPIMVFCLAIIGVGANLNWYTMDIIVEGKTIRIPNNAYSYVAHKCANLLIALPLMVFDTGYRIKTKWIAIFLIVLICALKWEVGENEDVQKHGQSLMFYNTPEDSEFDITASVEACAIAFFLHYACWFTTATPEEIMAKKFGRRVTTRKKLVGIDLV